MGKESILKAKMYDYGKLIGLNEDSNIFPRVVKREQVFTDGKFMYVSEGSYNYVHMERGKENKHFEHEDLTEILYFVFDDITFELSKEYAVEHRNQAYDFREILFNKQLELIKKICDKYWEMKEHEINKVLEETPYKR